MKDVGFNTGNGFSADEKTTGHMTMHHSFLAHEILSKLETKRPLLMKSSPEASALHFQVGSEADRKMINRVFEILTRIAGKYVESKRLSKDEILSRGYDGTFVKQAVEFVNDGYFPPYIGEEMEEVIRAAGGKADGGLKLKKVLIEPTEGGEDARVSRIICERIPTKKLVSFRVKSLYLSLGPSNLSVDVIPPSINKGGNGGNLLEKVEESVNKTNLLNPMMWAAGASMVFVVKVDEAIVGSEAMRRFRDHIDGHNKHVVRLGEKTLRVDGGKEFRLFAFQATSGGHFPTKDVHPEAALNVFRTFVRPILGLDGDGVEFDVVAARSCARGIAAANTFCFSTPAANMAMVYGIGGIGMTTMPANALLLHALLALRRKLAEGRLSEAEFRRRISTSDFGRIPNWSGKNPFARNYIDFVDSVKNPKIIWKKMKRATEREMRKKRATTEREMRKNVRGNDVAHGA